MILTYLIKLMRKKIIFILEIYLKNESEIVITKALKEKSESEKIYKVKLIYEIL